MRPYIDIPWGIHGRVKQYADEHDLSTSEAYAELLKLGLQADHRKS